MMGRWPVSQRVWPGTGAFMVGSSVQLFQRAPLFLRCRWLPLPVRSPRRLPASHVVGHGGSHQRKEQEHPCGGLLEDVLPM